MPVIIQIISPIPLHIHISRSLQIKHPVLPRIDMIAGKDPDRILPLPEHIRITIGTEAEVKAVRDSLARFVAAK